MAPRKATAFRNQHRRHHDGDARDHHRQIDLPLRARRKVFDQHDRQHDEQRHQDRMQDQDADVQAHQLRIAQHRGQRDRRCRQGLAVDRVRHHETHHQHGRQRQDAGHRKNARHADQMSEGGPCNHRRGKGGADAHADNGHRLGAVLVTGQVRGERDHRGGNCARALNRAPDHDQVDVLRERGDETAGGKYDQPEINGGFAPPAIRQAAEGDLQQGLGESVDAQRKSDQGLVVAAGQLPGVQGEHRKDDKHPQHPESGYPGKPHTRAQFAGRHTVRRLHGEML
jgi:hypothetical protein